MSARCNYKAIVLTEMPGILKKDGDRLSSLMSDPGIGVTPWKI